MYSLNLPDYPHKIKQENNKAYIFDFIRKKYLVLTPEEWVRQHFVHYLITLKKFPSSLIVIEKGLKLNEMQKRADVLVYNKNGNPLVLVECKAATVKITQETFNQIARYNMVFHVPYLIVTNGLQHYCCKIDFNNQSFAFLDDIPMFDEMR
ncbi:MAG: restriction endonuclease subunit R [Flavobacteriales bacterium CG18_big_fil_WC_8_21_14_2_50_32_9]|nr:MAG: restriction endonuclease subunit R [Flavobacteriales bacterium CG18_big_fil_WC_8_21_14_2_50_32_9]